MPIEPKRDDPVFDVADMDLTTSPGDDFYRYANGGWMAANPVPSDHSRWAAFDEVRKANEDMLHELLQAAAAGDEPSIDGRVAAYYRAGMDTEQIERHGLAPLAEHLAAIDAIEDVAGLRSVAARLAEVGVSLPIDAGVLPDFDDSTTHLLYLDQGGLGLPERDYYFREDEQSSLLRKQYVQHVAAMLELGGHPDPGDSAAAILDLETALAEPSYTNTQQRNMDLVLNRFAATDLEALMPRFGLPAFLDSVGVTGIEAVNVGNPGFFGEVDEILTSVSVETLRAYATWHLLSAAASSLPKRFEDESFDFYGRILGGQQEQKERWKRVLRAATAEIGELVGKVYVAHAFGPEAKERAQQMVANIIEAMAGAIRSLEWMGDETKVAALAKLDGFSAKLGYPDVWRDYTALSFSGGPWVTLRLDARSFEFRRRLGQLHEPVDPNEWSMAPHEVNAYYHPLRNEIVFPAGILQPPFFDATADDPINYGGIGAVIGHEITHGFDDMGSRFDASGNFANWWSEEDRAEFERRADVLVDQYDGYRVVGDLPVNGRLTLGENIADLGGLTIAFEALRVAIGDMVGPLIGRLTPAQRFFLSFARVWRSNETDEYLRLNVQTDPHSPPMFRCNGALGNLDEFARAFDLDDDDPMMRAPNVRAKVW
jgi:predicted metalloendopeptidase